MIKVHFSVINLLKAHAIFFAEGDFAMRKILLLLATLSAPALGGEAYDETSDRHAAPETYESAKMKIEMGDKDPFRIKTPGHPSKDLEREDPTGSEDPPGDPIRSRGLLRRLQQSLSVRPAGQ
jgi:hypothetical protein